MIELFERQVGKCRTPNEVNRLHIALENRITPLEFAELSRVIMDRYPSTRSKRWIEKLSEPMNACRKREPEKFVRQRIKSNLCVYSDGGPTKDKMLIVAFPGGARRLMMPTPVFLQNLPAERVDVLFLQRHHHWRYYNGLGGLSTSFDGLIDAIGDTIRGWKYRRTLAFGTSAGGLPAILAALYLKLEAGISIGGGSPENPNWRFLMQSERLRRALTGYCGQPKLLSVFGEKNENDATFALELNQLVPIEFLKIPDEPAHGAIRTFMYTGELGDFLRSTLFELDRGSSL